MGKIHSAMQAINSKVKHVKEVVKRKVRNCLRPVNRSKPGAEGFILPVGRGLPPFYVCCVASRTFGVYLGILNHNVWAFAYVNKILLFVFCQVY